MSNEKQFFDYSSEEYQELRIRADASESEARVAREKLDRAREELRAAETQYYVARARADREFQPLNEWYKRQSKLRDEWRRQQGEADGE